MYTYIYGHIINIIPGVECLMLLAVVMVFTVVHMVATFIEKCVGKFEGLFIANSAAEHNAYFIYISAAPPFNCRFFRLLQNTLCGKCTKYIFDKYFINTIVCTIL